MFKKYDLEEQLKEFGFSIAQLTDEITARAKLAMGILQLKIHAKIVEKAQEKLKSTRDIYIANLGMMNETDNLYVVYLKKEAAWIEDGIKPHEMIDDLTSGPKAKHNTKDGSRYAIIPFQHNKPPTQTSRAQMQIQNVVNDELKKRGLDKTIKIGKKAVLGKAASINVTDFASSVISRRSLLAGLTIYQKKVGKKVMRDVMTFRVVSTKQKGSGMWFHPGSKGVNLFAEVEKEVDQMWDQLFKDVVGQVKIEGT